MGVQPRLITPFYVAEESYQHHSPPPAGSGNGTTYEVVVGAADGLLGARSTSSRTNGRDRAAAEPEETADCGKGDPEHGAEVVERRGGRLQREQWLAQRAIA